MATASNSRCNSFSVQNDAWSKEICFFPMSKLEHYEFEKRISCYLIGKRIGQGLFAAIHEGLHIVTGEKVAIKVLDKQKLRNDFYANRHLYREAKILRYISHPRVVQLLETFETDNNYYLTMELICNTSLADILEENGKLSEDRTKKYIKQIIEATDYLHAQDIIHRDLKLENILVDEDDSIKIIDFGLSTFTKTRREKANVFFIRKLCQSQCGSPAYTAPELLAIDEYGPKADIWSIGVDMFAMLTASLPFTTQSADIKELHQKIMSFQINPVPDSLSEDAIDLMFKFLSVDPRERISLSNARKHKWLSNSCNNNLQHLEMLNDSVTLPKDIEKQIIRAMHKKLGLSQESITRAIKLKIPSYASATFKLTLAKIQRYHTKLYRSITNDLSEFHIASSKKLIQTHSDNKMKASDESLPSSKIEPNKKGIINRHKRPSKKDTHHPTSS